VLCTAHTCRIRSDTENYIQYTGQEKRHGHDTLHQGRTDNSWGPRAIGDHGAPVSLPKLKKAYEKVPGASHGAPYCPGPLGSARVSKWSVRPCSALI
ncbi:unnamed protein product, partial [Staurois parvus]